MLTNLFESRNKTFLNLVKLGDYIGRSLRENVELFSVDDTSVTYLTESGKAIKGNFDRSALSLTNIKVENANIFENKEVYSKLVDKKVNGFLADILENDLEKVQESFDSILGLWETRLHFDRAKARLSSKSERFDEKLKIIATPEFQRVVELKNDLVKLLKESDNFINIPEIRNTIKLSSVISKSFNVPKLDYETLAESQSYQIPNTVNHTLYDHLCKQELIAKEFVESKNDLEHVWIINDKIQKLPSFIYESDENVMQLVAEIVSELPYFAMATKKQLTSLVEGNLDLLVDKNVVPAKDIREFVAKIFEYKKPVRNYVVNLLNEKYGVNIQSLTDTPTFDSLIKTQILIFESLAKLSPKNSVLKKVLYEFSECLKNKNGIESIDVTDFLNEVFEECEYTSILNETTLMNYLNFDKVADDLGKIGQVLKMIQAGMGMGGGAPMSGGMGAPAGAGMGAVPGVEGAAKAMAEPMQPGEGEYEEDGGELAGMGELPDMEGETGDQMPAMDAADAAAEVQGEEGEEEEGMNPDKFGDDIELVDKGQLVDDLAELEELIATLKSDMGMGGEKGGGEFGAEGEEGEDEEGSGEEFGGEEEMSDEEGGEESSGEVSEDEAEDAIESDIGSEDSESEGGGEEEGEEPKFKPKKKKSKDTKPE